MLVFPYHGVLSGSKVYQWSLFLWPMIETAILFSPHVHSLWTNNEQVDNVCPVTDCSFNCNCPWEGYPPSPMFLRCVLPRVQLVFQVCPGTLCCFPRCTGITAMTAGSLMCSVMLLNCPSNAKLLLLRNKVVEIKQGQKRRFLPPNCFFFKKKEAIWWWGGFSDVLGFELPFFGGGVAFLSTARWRFIVLLVWKKDIFLAVA